MTYAERVRQLEAEGCTTSDAQSVADCEVESGKLKSDAWCQAVLNGASFCEAAVIASAMVDATKINKFGVRYEGAK
jgi:hypothetical protein